jgi:hypothetical protein
MTDAFALVTPAQLRSGNDPVELLDTAATLAELLAIQSYDPESTDLWALAKVRPTDRTVQILNASTNQPVTAIVCGLEP